MIHLKVLVAWYIFHSKFLAYPNDGCLELGVAMLPTQFYMALLYTITTVILTGQTIYYSHIYHQLKAEKSRATSKRGDTSLREKLLGARDGGASRNNHQSFLYLYGTDRPIEYS